MPCPWTAGWPLEGDRRVVKPPQSIDNLSWPEYNAYTLVFIHKAITRTLSFVHHESSNGFTVERIAPATEEGTTMKSRFLFVIVVVVALLVTAAPSVVTGQTAVPDAPEDAVLELTANAPVYSWPQDGAQQLSVLPAGSSVPTNGRLVDSTWWQIPFPGGPNGNAWVQAANVEPNDAAQNVQTYELKNSAQATPSPAPGDGASVTLTTDSTVMAWPDDNAQPLGKLPTGSTLPTNGRLADAQWWQIPYPGGSQRKWLAALRTTSSRTLRRRMCRSTK